MFPTVNAPSLWREMERFQREMNRLFDEFYPTRIRRAPSYPAMNVWGNGEGLLVTAEMPGVRPEDIDVRVEDDTLIISGERHAEEVPENAHYHRRERGYGKFSRALQLPFSIEVDKVEAGFKNGILSITLPRAEAEKPKKIVVKS